MKSLSYSNMLEKIGFKIEKIFKKIRDLDPVENTNELNTLGSRLKKVTMQYDQLMTNKIEENKRKRMEENKRKREEDKKRKQVEDELKFVRKQYDQVSKAVQYDKRNRKKDKKIVKDEGLERLLKKVSADNEVVSDVNTRKMKSLSDRQQKITERAKKTSERLRKLNNFVKENRIFLEELRHDNNNFDSKLKKQKDKRNDFHSKLLKNAENHDNYGYANNYEPANENHDNYGYPNNYELTNENFIDFERKMKEEFNRVKKIVTNNNKDTTLRNKDKRSESGVEPMMTRRRTRLKNLSEKRNKARTRRQTSVLEELNN